MNQEVISSTNILDEPIKAVKPVIFKSTDETNWKGGLRSEPIYICTNLFFYYRINKKGTADFMVGTSFYKIKSLEIIDLSYVKTIDELINKLQHHFNNFVCQFSVKAI